MQLHPSAPGPRSRWPTPTARSRRWSPRYALVAYGASWLVIGAVSLGLWIPVHGIGALSIDAAWVATLIPLYRSGRLRWADLGFRAISPLRGTALVGAELEPEPEAGAVALSRR